MIPSEQGVPVFPECRGWAGDRSTSITNENPKTDKETELPSHHLPDEVFQIIRHSVTEGDSGGPNVDHRPLTKHYGSRVDSSSPQPQVVTTTGRQTSHVTDRTPFSGSE